MKQIEGLFLILFLVTSPSFSYIYLDPIYSVNNIKIGDDFLIKDFYLYDDNYKYTWAFARVQYLGENPINSVTLNLDLFYQGIRVKSQLYCEPDYVTYGVDGMGPNEENVLSTSFDKTKVDSVLFYFSYASDDGSKPRLNKNALKVNYELSGNVGDPYRFINGNVENTSSTPIKYPHLVISFYTADKMVFYEHVRVMLLGTNTLGPGSTAQISTAIQWPAKYDSIKWFSAYNLIYTGNVNIIDGEARAADSPKLFLLSQNYPNPFNSTTSFNFYLSSNTNVSLKIFDRTGKEVAILVSKDLSAGTHSEKWEAKNFPSGIYFYRLQAGTYVETKKLTILK